MGRQKRKKTHIISLGKKLDFLHGRAVLLHVQKHGESKTKKNLYVLPPHQIESKEMLKKGGKLL